MVTITLSLAHTRAKPHVKDIGNTQKVGKKLIMGNRLTRVPQRWFVECEYCKLTDYGHETELLHKAAKLCKHHESNHFLDFVTAEFDRLDHSVLSPIGQIEVLTEIHQKTGCDCLSGLTSAICTMTTTPNLTNTHHIPTKPQNHQAKQSTPKPEKYPKTLLERLQKGRNK